MFYGALTWVGLINERLRNRTGGLKYISHQPALSRLETTIVFSKYDGLTGRSDYSINVYVTQTTMI